MLHTDDQFLRALALDVQQRRDLSMVEQLISRSPPKDFYVIVEPKLSLRQVPPTSALRFGRVKEL
jgi:hypothetical protein